MHLLNTYYEDIIVGVNSPAPEISSQDLDTGATMSRRGRMTYNLEQRYEFQGRYGRARMRAKKLSMCEYKGSLFKCYAYLCLSHVVNIHTYTRFGFCSDSENLRMFYEIKGDNK